MKLCFAIVMMGLAPVSANAAVIDFEGDAPVTSYQFQQDGYVVAVANPPSLFFVNPVGRLTQNGQGRATISRPDGTPFDLRRIDMDDVVSYVGASTSIEGVRQDGTPFFIEYAYRVTWDALVIEGQTKQGATVVDTVNPWQDGPAWSFANPYPLPVPKTQLFPGTAAGFDDIFIDLASLTLSFQFRDFGRDDEECHPSNWVRVDPRLELERQCTGQDLLLYDDDVITEVFDVAPQGASGPWIDLGALTLARSAGPPPPVAVIPLPASVWMLAAGLAWLGWRRR